MPDVIDESQWESYLEAIPRDIADADYGDMLQEKVAPIYRGRVDLNFALEQTAGGEGWAELSPVTIARKGHDRILEETLRMRAAATSRTGDSIQEATDKGLTVGIDPSGFPGSYPLLHETGTRQMPDRPFMNVNEETVDLVAAVVADDVVRRMKR